MQNNNLNLDNQDYVFFWKIEEDNAMFSNWYSCKFVIDDYEYDNVEQYIMSQKAKLFHDTKNYTLILKTEDPAIIKKLGREVKDFDQEIWANHRYEIAKKANRAKFSQNPKLKSALIKTGKRILAEASPKDGVWGLQMDVNEAANCNPKFWTGQNLLGKILMEIRDEFCNESCEIKFIKADITKVSDVEAIVNAANKTLLGGGGVDGAIHHVAGPELKAECSTLNGCDCGDAKITKAYRLACEYVIHTVGPIWRGGIDDEDLKLASCYIRSLEIAKDQRIRTIAFPSISTGAYNFPLDRAAHIAVFTVSNYIKHHPTAFNLIKWVLFDEQTYEAYVKAFNNLK